MLSIISSGNRGYSSSTVPIREPPLFSYDFYKKFYPMADGNALIILLILNKKCAFCNAGNNHLQLVSVAQ
jgi:hypothetical protein